VNIPISLVAQNLFFKALKILRLSYLSHSKYKTVSTICSRVFGHAKFQSFVICHIINTAVLLVFAKATSNSLIYLTWLTLQATQVTLFECITEIESITTISDLFLLRVSSMSSMQLSASSFILFQTTQSLFALSEI